MDRFERIAFCIIAVQLVLIFVVWRITPPTPPAPQPPPLPELPRSHESTYYAVHAHDRADPARLGEIADRVHHEARKWLEVPSAPDTVDSRLPIFVCDSLDTMRQATEHIYWPQAPQPTTLRPALGRYLGIERGIVVVGTEPRLRRTVAHEVVHHVISLFSPSCPTALNEGAAVYLATRFSGWNAPSTMWRTRAQQIRKMGAMDLRTLIELESADFHGEQQHGHYALAAVTVRFLAECEDPAVRGRAPRLFAAIDRSSDPWACFGRIYNEERVASLWQAEVDVFLKRQPKHAVKPR